MCLDRPEFKLKLDLLKETYNHNTLMYIYNFFFPFLHLPGSNLQGSERMTVQKCSSFNGHLRRFLKVTQSP